MSKEVFEEEGGAAKGGGGGVEEEEVLPRKRRGYRYHFWTLEGLLCSVLVRPDRRLLV